MFATLIRKKGKQIRRAIPKAFDNIQLVQRAKILIKRLPGSENLPLPAYQSAGASGMDVVAAVPQETTIAPGARALIPTGLAMAIPPGYEVQVRPRSGLALKHGITLLNTPGTIDADYRGEVGIILYNAGEAPFMVTRGMRIAQLVVAEVMQAEIEEVQNLESTARGSGGFGSTGTEGTP